MRQAWILVLGVGMASASAMAQGVPSPSQAQTTEFAKKVRVLRAHRILFSHHSVGHNLLQGLERAVARSGDGPLEIQTLAEAERKPEAPAFVSVTGGRNQDPESKLEFFAKTLKATAFKPQLAFMKFCYIDFNPDTDVERLFSAYKRTIDGLKQAYPQIRFVHVTVPLTARPNGLKHRVARWLGRAPSGDRANAKRHAFNERLRGAYLNDPIFDLARIESTEPDGSRVAFRQGGRAYYALAQQYTDDGGHLNTLGQDVAAIAWVNFLVGAIEGRSSAARR